MPYKDPNDKKRHDREYARKRREEADKKSQTVPLRSPEEYKTIAGLLDVAARAMREIEALPTDPISKGRALALLIDKAQKLIESYDLHEKVAELERLIKEE